MPDIFSPDETNDTPAQQPPASPPPEAPQAATPSSEPQDNSILPTSNENHIHALASYCQTPSTLIFQGKDITDNLHFFLRRHVVTNVPWIIITILLFFIPPLVQFLLLHSPSTPQIPTNFAIVFVLFYYLVVIMYAFLSFLNWFYNIIIVTTTEVIDVDYADIVYHDLAATNVNLIEDVQYIQSGFIPGLFNFGDVYVQTAGGKENIEALAIPQPAEIARFILSYIGKGELGG